MSVHHYAQFLCRIWRSNSEPPLTPPVLTDSLGRKYLHDVLSGRTESQQAGIPMSLLYKKGKFVCVDSFNSGHSVESPESFNEGLSRST